jgi:hypothetical protein
MGASEWGKPPNALRAKGIEKEEDIAYLSTGYVLTVWCLVKYWNHFTLPYLTYIYPSLLCRRAKTWPEKRFVSSLRAVWDEYYEHKTDRC